MPNQTELDPRRQLHLLSVEDLDGARELCAAGEFCWMDLEDPDPESIQRVGEELGLHPLAIEDTQEFGQRPKLDVNEDQLLVVYFGATEGENDTVELVEVHIHVSGHFLLTVHRRPCPALIALHERVSRDPPDSQQKLIYRMLDTLTDSLLDVLDDVVATVSDREATVFRRPRARDRDELAEIRRSLDNSRRIILTQRQMFDRMVERLKELPGFSKELRPNYADISDHLWRAVDDMETAREGLQGMIDQYSNAVQERLTIVATIFLPLTVVTGFFGQNFNWLINSIGSAWTFWGLGVGGLIASVITIWAWLIKTGMYDRTRKGRQSG